MSRTSLHCFYDMAVSPCSFDFFTFYISAEVCRIRRNLDDMIVYIVEGPNKGFRGDTIRSFEQNQNFFHNVMIPGLSLLPSCSAFHLLDRQTAINMKVPEENLFPRSYRATKPNTAFTGHDLVAALLRGDRPGRFEAPAYARAMAEEFRKTKVGDSRFFTLTAREVARQNSSGKRSVDVETWAEITAMDNGYKTVLVRDTEHAFGGDELIPGAIECPEASIHLPFRFALYELADINFFKNNGPAFLMCFSSKPGVCFNVHDENEIALSRQWLRDNWAVDVGDNIPLTTTNKFLIWDRERVPFVADMLEKAQTFDNASMETHPLGGPVSTQLAFGMAGGHLLRGLVSGVLEEDVPLYRALKRISDANPALERLDEVIKSFEGKELKPGILQELQRAAA